MRGRFDGKTYDDGKTPQEESICSCCGAHTQPMREVTPTSWDVAHGKRFEGPFRLCVFCYESPDDPRRAPFVIANILRKDLGRIETKLDTLLSLMAHRQGGADV